MGWIFGALGYVCVGALVALVVADATRDDEPKHWPVGALLVGVLWLPVLLLGALCGVVVWIADHLTSAAGSS